MLNDNVGRLVQVDLGTAIQTSRGARGHAVYGPYVPLGPGRYEVIFKVRLVDHIPQGRDPLCAVIDVALDQGASSPAYDFVFASQLGDQFTDVTLPFALDRSAIAEFRLFTAGHVVIEVMGEPVLTALPAERSTCPVPQSTDIPLLADHPSYARILFEQGLELTRVGSGLQATLDGIAFNANTRDDVNFVDELFWKKAYNFLAGRETCVVDVGMNVGLASLLFAAKSGVREVHSFEPFPETFARGMANLALNPALSSRIVANNFGLGDGDENTTFLVANTGGDSGAQSTRNSEGGTPVTLTVRDAGAALAPILTGARERGLRRVVKVDCEGAEFAIFESLTRAGLWTEIEALMVEWHQAFPGRTQEELLAPLLDAGFVVIDLSSPSSNGFFYAFRVAG